MEFEKRGENSTVYGCVCVVAWGKTVVTLDLLWTLNFDFEFLDFEFWLEHFVVRCCAYILTAVLLLL